MLGKRRRHPSRLGRSRHASGPSRPLFRPVLRYILNIEQYWVDTIQSAILLPLSPEITGRSGGAPFFEMYNNADVGSSSSDPTVRMDYWMSLPPWMVGCRLATAGFRVNPYCELLGAYYDSFAVTVPDMGVYQGRQPQLVTALQNFAYVRGLGAVWSWADVTPRTTEAYTMTGSEIPWGEAQPLEHGRVRPFGFFQHSLRREDPMITWMLEGHDYTAALPENMERDTHVQVDWLYRGYKAHGVQWPQRRRRWVPFYSRSDASYIQYSDSTLVSIDPTLNDMGAYTYTIPAGGRLCPLPSIPTGRLFKAVADISPPSVLDLWGGAGAGGYCLFIPLRRQTFTSYTVLPNSSDRRAIPYNAQVTTAALPTPCVLKIQSRIHYLLSGPRVDSTPTTFSGMKPPQRRMGYQTGAVDVSGPVAVPFGAAPPGSRSGELVPDWVSGANPDGECM